MLLVTSGVIVKLILGQVIEGDVRDEAGKGISGVHVWISAERGEGQPWVPDGNNNSQTDAKGHFRADRLGPGVYTVNARHDDYVDESLPGVQAGTTGIAITLTRGRSISGRVTLPDGQPAAGVQVSANAPNRGWEWAMTDT